MRNFGSTAATFGRARRRKTYRRLRQAVTGRVTVPELLALDDAEHRLRPFSRRYVGVRSIPVRHIVGTEGRARDFDRDFLPQRRELESRWRGVETAFPDGAFPPIVVNKLGEAYFVIDGHHRVAIARQLGMETIDAEVTELSAIWQLRPDSDPRELMHAEQFRIFMAESGLGEVIPSASIRFTQPWGYSELLEHVHRHGYRLMRARDEVLAPREIAADWFEHVYTPAQEIFRREGLAPLATEGDLFLCTHDQHREHLAECSHTTLEATVRRMVERGSEPKRARLRRLLVPDGA